MAAVTPVLMKVTRALARWRERAGGEGSPFWVSPSPQSSPPVGGEEIFGVSPV